MNAEEDDDNDDDDDDDEEETLKQHTVRSCELWTISQYVNHRCNRIAESSGMFAVGEYLFENRIPMHSYGCVIKRWRTSKELSIC